MRSIFYLALLVNTLAFCEVINAHYHFHSYGAVPMPYYQTPAWVENNIIEKETIIDVPPVSSHEEVIIALQRIEAIDLRKSQLQEKLDYPGIMSLRYRRQLEKEIANLNTEKLRIKAALSEHDTLHPFESHTSVIVDPFPLYGPVLYRHNYPHFIHRFR